MSVHYPPYLARPGGPLARSPGRDALRSAALHESSHSVVGEALGYRTGRIRIDGRGGGGYRRAADGRGGPTPAVVLIAGQVGAKLLAEDGPQFRLRHEGDDAQIREATGGRRDLRDAAEREARNILLCHRKSVRAIAERLLAVGTLEGAELDELLLPVRTEYVRRFVKGAA